MAQYQKNQLYSLPLSELRPDPAQPRKHLDPAALEELAQSVARMGIIQPVVCRQEPDTGQVYVVAGERRCMAAMQAGLAEVPALFIDGGNHAEVALVENLIRQDLNPVEEAEALQRLMEEHDYAQEQLAVVIGKSQPSISRSLSLNRLPREIRDACRQDPTVPRNVLLDIAGMKQERGMLTRFNKYKERQARIAADQGADHAPAPHKRSQPESIAQGLGGMADRIRALAFAGLSEADRVMLLESMKAMQAILADAISRATNAGKAPTRAPMKAAVKAPVKAAEKAAGNPAVKGPLKSPARAPAKLPVKAAAKAPMKAPARTPARTPAGSAAKPSGGKIKNVSSIIK